jgi:hypothetical protein
LLDVRKIPDGTWSRPFDSSEMKTWLERIQLGGEAAGSVAQVEAAATTHQAPMTLYPIGSAIRQPVVFP